MADPNAQNDPTKKAEPQKPANPQSQPAQKPAPPQAPDTSIADGPADRVAGRVMVGGQAAVTDADADLGATRKASIEAGNAAVERKKATASPIPTSAELERFREEQFGGKGGTVRIDAQPARRKFDAGPTKLVFFDAAGRKVGEKEYYGPDDADDA